MGLEYSLRKLYDICDWIMKLMYVNFLWVLFVLIGLGVAGFFPSTTAAFTVIRGWMIGDKYKPIFPTFWKAYKQSFKQINIIGYALIFIGVFLAIDLRLLQMSENLILSALSFFFFFLLFIYVTVLLYIIPMYVHYQFRTLEYIKYAFIIAIGRPIITIMMFVGGFLLYLLFTYVPVLFVFFGGSMISYLFLWISMKAFSKESVRSESILE